MLTILQVKFV